MHPLSGITDTSVYCDRASIQEVFSSFDASVTEMSQDWVCLASISDAEWGKIMTYWVKSLEQKTCTLIGTCDGLSRWDPDTHMEMQIQSLAPCFNEALT